MFATLDGLCGGKAFPAAREIKRRLATVQFDLNNFANDKIFPDTAEKTRPAAGMPSPH